MASKKATTKIRSRSRTKKRDVTSVYQISDLASLAEVRIVMIIMPFRETPSRQSDQLDYFFTAHLKKPIESASLQNKYQVIRSDDRFNINDQIIRDLYRADIVICDLSGITPNPNVMYELGMRLAFSDKPVILIRETHPQNQQTFDISGFYTYHYDPYKYHILEEYLIGKISRFESGEEQFRSPVRDVLLKSGASLEANSNGQAMHAITSLSLGLIMSATGHYNVVRQFITEKYPDLEKFPEDAHEIEDYLDVFSQRLVELSELNWEGFNKWPSSNPPMDMFWQSSQLSDLLPSVVYFNLLGFMSNFYQRYLSTNDNWWSIAPAYATARYFIDTLALLEANKYIKTLLSGEGGEDFAAISQMAIECLQISPTWINQGGFKIP